MARQDWETPIDVFEKAQKLVEHIGPITLDVCATYQNAKCNEFYPISENGLNQPWHKVNWCNPPYGNIAPWAYKALEEKKKGNTTVLLVPSNRSDQQWWADIWPYVEVVWIRGRVKFVGAVDSPPFAVCYLIMKGD